MFAIKNLESTYQETVYSGNTAAIIVNGINIHETEFNCVDSLQ